MTEKRERDNALNERRRQRIRDRRRQELEDEIAEEDDTDKRDIMEGRLLLHTEGKVVEYEYAPTCWHCGTVAKGRPYASDIDCPNCGREEAYVKHIDKPPPAPKPTKLSWRVNLGIWAAIWWSRIERLWKRKGDRDGPAT